MRIGAVGVAVLASLVAVACCAAQAAIEADGETAAVVAAERRIAVPTPGPGDYFLEMTATIPEELGNQTICHTVWINNKQVQYVPQPRPEGTPWNVGYVPYFTLRSQPQPHASGQRQAELLFLQRLHLPNGAELTIAPAPGGQVLATRLRPAMAGVSATVAFSGTTQHVYFPGEAPTASVELTGLPEDGPLGGYAVVQHLRLADTWGEAGWHADIRVVEARQVLRVPLEQFAGSGDRATVTIPLPTDRHGVLGITVVIEQGERIWARYLGAASIVPQRVTKRAAADGIFIATLAELFRDNEVMSVEPMSLEDMAAVYKKIGIDWVRCGPNWAEFEPQPGAFAWEATDRLVGILRDNGLLAMHVAQIAPTWARPDTDPALQEMPYQDQTIKVDWAPLPEFLPQWERAHEQLYRRHRDVIRASNVWNEPWEGMGTTGWKSTGDHYRRLVQGIRRAVDRGDPTMKVVAADSAYNTDWKLFTAGLAETIDVISTHYSTPRNAAFAMAKHYNKDLWDTETWLAWAGDAASVRHTLYFLANGGDKISLWNYRMLFDHEGNPLPSTAWTAGVRHMLDGLKFRQVIRPQHPPFVLLFENIRGQDRHVAAVMSTLSAGVRGRDGEFRSQFAAGRSRMKLAWHPQMRVMDLLANPIELQADEAGMIEIRVDAEPRFIESREPIEQFVQRLEAAVHRDLRPVEIVLHNITQRPDAGAAVQVTLRNAYAEPLPVQVKLSAPGLTFPPEPQEATLKPAGEQTLAFPILRAEMAANAYRAMVEVSSPHGMATHSETIHFSLIVRGTPVVDGDVSEWPGLGAVPVRLRSEAAPRNEQLKAWPPWDKPTESQAGHSAEVAFAADDQYLYMMAQVRDETRSLLPSMLAGQNLHVMQNPPAQHVYIKSGPIPGETGDLIQLALGPIDSQHYLSAEELYPPGHPLRRAGSYLSTLYKYMLYPTADGGAEIMRMRTPSFYFRHPLPIDYEFLRRHCRVQGAQVVVKVLEDRYVYEAAVPWSELVGVPHAVGDRLMMSFVVQDDQRGRRLEWSRGRSAARLADLDFEPAWGVKWSSETQWGVVGK